jgi:hypothetical protein
VEWQKRQMTRILNIQQALELHGVIQPYLSDIPKDNPVVFIRTLVGKMLEVDPLSYIYCVEMLADKPRDDILKMKSSEILTEFVDGMVRNRIFDLLDFADWIYSNAD